MGEKIASGPARVIEGLHRLGEFRSGEVLVADTTTPDWEPVMKNAAGIVTNRGGRTCHAAIVARELGVPAVVGTGDATTSIAAGKPVTVSCAEGDVGRVYDGEVAFRVERTEVADLARPATRIMVTLGDPDLAFTTSFLPNDGVGLARMELIISESIKAHPLALVHPDRVTDAKARAAIARLLNGYESGEAFFVERLSEGIGTIAAANWPNPLVVRMSDFKTNEYASLIGGADFEPHEDNPMLGLRGASRYAHPAYAEGFALECAALRRVREQMGLTNVVLVDRFAALFDGFSVGSNDLTQLTLGVDRDSEIVAFDYDERDGGVKEMIRLAVEGCRRNGIHSGLCGQAPSDYPDMAEFLVEIGIDSMSLDPDTVIETTKNVLEVEQRLGRPPRASGEDASPSPPASSGA